MSASQPSLHIRRAHSQAGFSLVELMVVVFLVGLAATFIVITAPPNRSPALIEAERLTGVLELAAQQSVVSGQTYALSADNDRYWLQVRRDGNWQTVAGSTHRLHDDVSLSLPPRQRENSNQYKPIAVFEPLGVASAQSLGMRHHSHSVEIEIGIGGQISILEPGRAR